MVDALKELVTTPTQGGVYGYRYSDPRDVFTFASVGYTSDRKIIALFPLIGTVRCKAGSGETEFQTPRSILIDILPSLQFSAVKLNHNNNAKEMYYHLWRLRGMISDSCDSSFQEFGEHPWIGLADELIHATYPHPRLLPDVSYEIADLDPRAVGQWESFAAYKAHQSSAKLADGLRMLRKIYESYEGSASSSDVAHLEYYCTLVSRILHDTPPDFHGYMITVETRNKDRFDVSSFDVWKNLGWMEKDEPCNAETEAKYLAMACSAAAMAIAPSPHCAHCVFVEEAPVSRKLHAHFVGVRQPKPGETDQDRCLDMSQLLEKYGLVGSLGYYHKVNEFDFGEMDLGAEDFLRFSNTKFFYSKPLLWDIIWWFLYGCKFAPKHKDKQKKTELRLMLKSRNLPSDFTSCNVSYMPGAEHIAPLYIVNNESPTKISGLVFSSNWRENSTNVIHPGYAPAFIWSKEWTNPLLMRFSDAELKSMFSYRDALKKPSAPPSAALPFTSGASAAAERPQTGQRIFH